MATMRHDASDREQCQGPLASSVMVLRRPGALLRNVLPCS